MKLTGPIAIPSLSFGSPRPRFLFSYILYLNVSGWMRRQQLLVSFTFPLMKTHADLLFLRLKNPNSKLVQTLNSGFSIRRRIALTGDDARCFFMPFILFQMKKKIFKTGGCCSLFSFPVPCSSHILVVFSNRCIQLFHELRGFAH